ncbi:hypothetical protein AHiyo1_49120, partial [Arthrobacter sp. Hiyo1]
MTLDCPPRSHIRDKAFRRNSDLLRNIGHRRGIEPIWPSRESRLDLEELQQQSEAQPCRAGLLAKQAQITSDPCPVLNKSGIHSTTITQAGAAPLQTWRLTSRSGVPGLLAVFPRGAALVFVEGPPAGDGG